jgi:hypothetical protein
MNSSADRSTLESGRDHSVEDRGIGRILTQLIQDMEGKFPDVGAREGYGRYRNSRCTGNPMTRGKA